jgi:hypothetical protein
MVGLPIEKMKSFWIYENIEKPRFVCLFFIIMKKQKGIFQNLGTGCFFFPMTVFL